MDQGSFPSVFLKQSPSIICDQLLYLVKNSNLNFELHETPFSLNLNLKKSFYKHWNKSKNSAENNPFNAPHASHYATDHVHHQPHHPAAGQPCQLSPDALRKSQNHNFTQIQVPQPQQHHPQQEPDLVHQPSVVDAPAAHTGVNMMESIKAEHNETLRDYAELDKAHRKLGKDFKDLEAKHSKVCSAMKTLKTENEELAKEGNALSVALKSSMKESELSKGKSEKETEALKAEIANLKEFKIQQQEQARKVKKLEKKKRQKEKKREPEVLNKSDLETTEISSFENCAEPEEKPNQVAQQISLSVEGEILPELKTETSEKIKDCENNLKHVKETYVFKSDDPRFLAFPDRFEDWSEDQKKDAYDNYFKLYLEKSLKVYSFGSLPPVNTGSLPK